MIHVGKMNSGDSYCLLGLRNNVQNKLTCSYENKVYSLKFQFFLKISILKKYLELFDKAEAPHHI